MFKKMILGLALVASANAMAADVNLTATVLPLRTITVEGDGAFGTINETEIQTKTFTLKLEGNKAGVVKMRASGAMIKVGADETSLTDAEKIAYTVTFLGAGKVTGLPGTSIDNFESYEIAAQKIADVAMNTTAIPSTDTIECTVSTVPNGVKNDGNYKDTITFEVSAN